LTAHLYAEFGFDAVYCFGSLTDNHGARFTETSDIDIAVRVLPARERFEAETRHAWEAVQIPKPDDV
jgi:predicted nucleotidyltransferase